MCRRHAGSYYRPEGFAFGDVEGRTAQIMDDENATEPSNVAQRVDDFVAAAERMAAHIDGNDVMFTMGGEAAAAQNLLLCLSMLLCSQGRTSICPLTARDEAADYKGTCLKWYSCRLGDNDWTYPFVWWRNLDKLIHHVNKVGVSSYLFIVIKTNPPWLGHGDACSVRHDVLQCRMGG